MNVPKGFPSGTVVKNLPVNAGAKASFNLRVRNLPWSRKWQPTPAFLPGKFHGQKSLVGYSPWGCQRVGHDWVTEYACSVYILLATLKMELVAVVIPSASSHFSVGAQKWCCNKWNWLCEGRRKAQVWLHEKEWDYDSSWTMSGSRETIWGWIQWTSSEQGPQATLSRRLQGPL